jgi:hypothetical protein
LARHLGLESAVLTMRGTVQPAKHREAGQKPGLAEPPPPARTLLQTALDTYRGSNSLQYRRLGAAASSTPSA